MGAAADGGRVMGGFSRGHVGAGDIPIGEIDEYGPAQLDADPFAQPFAATNPAPAEPVKEFCPACHWGLEASGLCWRCDIGCPRCGCKLDGDCFCCQCGGTFFPPAVRVEREAA